MIPHTGTARFVTSVIRSDEKSIDAVGRIPAQHVAVRDGRAPAFLGIELGAQAAAAMVECRYGLQPVQYRLKPVPTLARIREASFDVDDLPVDADLHVSAELEASAPPIAIYRIRVSLDGKEVVRATISTHQS